MPTLNRIEDVRRFMSALAAQDFRDLELIVVDQNADDSLRPVLAPFAEKIQIRHIQTGRPIGAVAARNMGAREATGEIVAFPDDDCFYEPGFLTRVDEHFKNHPEWDGLTGNVFGLERYYSKHAGPITKFGVWWQGLEFTLFFRKRIITQIGLMDPTFGPGAKTPWGAGEAADYLLRAIEAGFRLQYLPDLKVHHPGPLTNPRNDKAEAKCVYGYSMGKGHVLRSHDYPTWYVAYLAVRPLATAATWLAKLRWSKAAISIAVCRGVIAGYWLSMKSEQSPHDAAPLANSM